MLTGLFLGVVAAAGASLIACRLLIAAGLVDVPNAARKAHRQPTPTSGGLGIAIGFAIGVALVVLNFPPEWRRMAGADALIRAAVATAFACAFMALGFLDDARPMGPRMKFAIFSLLGIGSTLAVGVVQSLPLGGGVVLEFGWPLGVIGSALFVFTLVNAVNFMDGCNGLAMGSVAFGMCALGAVAMAHGAPAAAIMAACGAGALFGFLAWNFPNGLLFAGDSGALFAGALGALVSLLMLREGAVSPFIPPIIFFPILADVLLTLAWRVKKRRRILNGHAEHLYQIGMRSGLRHSQVSLIYWAACAVCGLIAYAASIMDASGHGLGDYAPPLALALLSVISIGISMSVRRFASARNMGEV
ncbi:MAG: glycosyltransferase family 4 protein [Hyphomonadaceae bacterium]